MLGRNPENQSLLSFLFFFFCKCAIGKRKMGKLTYIQANAHLLFYSFFKDFFFFFLMWTTFTAFIEFATTLLPFYVLVFLVSRPVGSQLPDGSNLHPRHWKLMS